MAIEEIEVKAQSLWNTWKDAELSMEEFRIELAKQIEKEADEIIDYNDDVDKIGCYSTLIDTAIKDIRNHALGPSRDPRSVKEMAYILKFLQHVKKLYTEE